MIERIISGGQTGADQAALRAAKHLGYQTGGWAPRGWRTQAGPAPWLGIDYGLVQASTSGYAERTALNVKQSDATLILGYPGSAGCNLTQRLAAGTYKKPWYWLRLDQDIRNPEEILRDWIFKVEGTVLNVAGNREENHPGIGELVEAILGEALIPF